MSNKIITIGRQFGSGGRTIGRLVADKLKIPFYDKELVKHVSVETGFAESFVEEKGEYSSSGSLLSHAFAPRVFGGAVHGMSIEDFLWMIQCRVIMQIAEKGSCVIVGRCADYILKDKFDCLNVFIHSDEVSRAERIVRLYGNSDCLPQKRLIEKDKRRAVYYKHYTDHEWGKADNYHISLNSSAIGIDKCVEIIVDLYKGL